MKCVTRICLLLLMTAFHAYGDDEVQQDGGHHHTRSSRHSRQKLRRIRHLGDKLESLVAEAAASTVNAGSGDNHKPVFTNCSRYQASVEEEAPSGTYVFQVQAMDQDPPDVGSTIMYSFVLAESERQKFAIDPHTGIITTRHIFDRDEPNREREVYLTVRATDNGSPQLHDVCTFKVVIEDINDNPPIFDKLFQKYVESVPQDLAPSSEVMRISATDLDDDNNSIVYYTLEGYEKLFRVDSNTGVIYLLKSIDQDPGFKFKLNATATDQGKPPYTSRIVLEIQVVESYKKAPTFTHMEPSQMPIKLKENRVAYNMPIVHLTAMSNIPGEPDLQFVLVSGRTDQTNKQNTFVIESYGTRAYIKQVKPLDFETVSEYKLTIRVHNIFNMAAERQIFIELEHVNDNIPAFTEVESGSVLENEPHGMPVMQVRAVDGNGTASTSN